ncbi:MAG: hypothetical protein P4L84_24520 [Isosphaeraceae bacterium]|nr:hypothetical protein [Isosphaeraceae bacterium]
MKGYWDSLQNVVIDRTPAELIGAIGIALVLSVTMTGLYQLGIRKVRDGVVLMTGLVVFACVISMAVAAGFLARSQYVNQGRFAPVVARRGSHRGRGGLEAHLARRLLALADRDKDGSLSAEEAADAAAAFTREAERTSRGPLAADALAEALRATVFPPPPSYEYQERYRSSPSLEAREHRGREVKRVD